MTVEFVGRMNPRPIKSSEQKLAEERVRFRADEGRRRLKRLGLLNEPEPEETRERFEDQWPAGPTKTQRKTFPQ